MALQGVAEHLDPLGGLAVVHQGQTHGQCQGKVRGCCRQTGSKTCTTDPERPCRCRAGTSPAVIGPGREGSGSTSKSRMPSRWASSVLPRSQEIDQRPARLGDGRIELRASFQQAGRPGRTASAGSGPCRPRIAPRRRPRVMGRFGSVPGAPSPERLRTLQRRGRSTAALAPIGPGGANGRAKGTGPITGQSSQARSAHVPAAQHQIGRSGRSLQDAPCGERAPAHMKTVQSRQDGVQIISEAQKLAAVLPWWTNAGLRSSVPYASGRTADTQATEPRRGSILQAQFLERLRLQQLQGQRLEPLGAQAVEALWALGLNGPNRASSSFWSIVRWPCCKPACTPFSNVVTAMAWAP